MPQQGHGPDRKRRPKRTGNRGTIEHAKSDANGRSSNSVQYPSSRVRSYAGLSWLRVSVPSNWLDFQVRTMSIRSEGAYGDQGITRGAMIGIYNGRNATSAATRKATSMRYSRATHISASEADWCRPMSPDARAIPRLSPGAHPLPAERGRDHLHDPASQRWFALCRYGRSRYRSAKLFVCVSRHA